MGGLCCLSFLEADKQKPKKAATSKAFPEPVARTCPGCSRDAFEFAQGSNGEQICRACLRAEDESLLEPLTPEERHGLDLLAEVLDSVSWKHWKPGDQPAHILNWLYLGDLEEAMDFDALARRGITAVLNLINWWELAARLPDVADLGAVYANRNIAFLEVDSEDRLFYDLVGKAWPGCEDFLKSCKNDGHRVLVNCKAGHNRSACVIICWLLVHEGMSLITAVEFVQQLRGTILSNHGFRLQLVRLALRLGLLGKRERSASKSSSPLHSPRPSPRTQGLEGVITRKRLSVKYDQKSQDWGRPKSNEASARKTFSMKKGLVLGTAKQQTVSQKSLQMELLARVYHRGKSFLSDYEYTSTPPTIVGSGFSGDVLLCRRRDRANLKDRGACVKTFNLEKMSSDHLEKLKNEAVIYLSLEHPFIARLFDVYENDKEVALVMQYCSGGTLEDAVRSRGVYSEKDVKDVAVQMLLALNYIHRLGIVHRDIKPRNFVYESDGTTLKLIDFGFSVKGFGDSNQNLQGCLGTLGYLAPEVIETGWKSDSAYGTKCDIWSFGICLYELLCGQPAFHREEGMCDGYTKEVVLREIQDITEEKIESLLADVPMGASDFLRRALQKDPSARPTAYEMFEDPYLADAKYKLLHPPRALGVSDVLQRFREHGAASKPCRAWLLAVARSPTQLPWEDFVTLRNTFIMFSVHGSDGMIDLATFCSVTSSDQTEVSEDEVQVVWSKVCGVQDKLCYCEFLAVMLPPADDVFIDVDPDACPFDRQLTPDTPCAVADWSDIEASVCLRSGTQWNPSRAVKDFLPMLQERRKIPVYEESTAVSDVVRAMNSAHLRWVIVKYRNGNQSFFDYMDVNHFVMTSKEKPSVVLAKASKMPVGALANCSGHAEFVATDPNTPLNTVLRRISGCGGEGRDSLVRRVPIIGANGQVLYVFSCLDFLTLALKFTGPTAIMKSRAARTFDCRETIMKSAVLHDDALVNALRTMAVQGLTVCPVTSIELSGTMGGVVASNVVSVADLKWVITEGEFGIMDGSVAEFIEWRSKKSRARASLTLKEALREQRLKRSFKFNVVSVQAEESLHTLAQRLLASKLQRIFLSSEEIARIVGTVSSRDILAEVLDQIV